MKNKLFCLVGTSGVGKTTIKKMLITDLPNLDCLPSYTTRVSRKSEENGIDYLYISEFDFINLINTNSLLEWEEHFGNYYGISKDIFQRKFSTGNSLIKEIAINGLAQLLELINKNYIVSIGIIPENIEDIKSRIYNDNRENPTERINNINLEISSISKCDYILTSKNGDIDNLFNEIKTIILKETSLEYNN